MLSALDLAYRIEKGDLRPSAVLEQCASAIAAREAQIGAFAALDLDAVRRRIVAEEAALATAPLRGLPVGIKDIIDTADLPTSYGSPIYAGHRPAADAAIVSMLRRAGGIVLGKTTTSEFAFRNPAHTRNPVDPSRAPGLSSSGSAAAVAAGMVPIALGTQTGGSIIGPAAYCGVVGFKPSFKLLPTVGIKCFSWQLDTVGLFAAQVADVAFAADAISGRPLRVDGLAPAAPRIGLLRTFWDEASPAMQDAVEHAAKCAAREGAAVRDIAMPAILAEALAGHLTIMGYEAWRSLAFEHDRHRAQLSEPLRAYLDEAAAITAESYDAARRQARRAREAFATMMKEEGLDVLLTPAVPGAAPPYGVVTSALFSRLWTLLGAPALTLPAAHDADGLPLGVQVVGRFGRDRETLAAARFIETALAGR